MVFFSSADGTLRISFGACSFSSGSSSFSSPKPVTGSSETGLSSEESFEPSFSADSFELAFEPSFSAFFFSSFFGSSFFFDKLLKLNFCLFRLFLWL
jgi:hypothetical protein